MSPKQEQARARGCTEGLYTPELRAWAKRVRDTFDERFELTDKGWVPRKRDPLRPIKR
jgi:hypothetical protein